MNYSFWEKKFIESYADITIIGSGIVGISTAISILEARPGTTVKVLERGALPYGASTKNAGFSCFGSVSELLDDAHSMGAEACAEIVGMRWQGLAKLKERAGLAALEYTDCGGTELFRKTDEVLEQTCMDNLGYCNQLIERATGLKDTYTAAENTELPGFSAHKIFNRHEGTINPVSMMNFLINMARQLGVKIHNGVSISVVDYQNRLLHAEGGLQIPYRLLVVCTNGFAARLLPSLDVLPARNQVLITRPVVSNRLSSGYHLDKGYVYFRNYEGRILLGGGRNLFYEEETTDQFGNTEGIKAYLTEMLETIHPGASGEIEHWWSGILGVGPSKYPITQWVNDNVLAGVRMGGMGVAIGSHLGEKLAAEVIAKLG